MEWKQEYGVYLSPVKTNAPNTWSWKQHCHHRKNQSLNLWDFYYLACVFMWFRFQIAWLHQQLHMHEGILLYGRLILEPLSF
jgi:hypothetical protein